MFERESKTYDESEERVLLDLSSRLEEVVKFESGLNTLKFLTVEELLLELVKGL